MDLRENKVLTFILAGGKGTRLYPLTRDRTKPAVPFAGRFRIIDFVLSSCINSGLRQIYVLTQTKSQSLDEHIRSGWGFLYHELREFIATIPPQQKISEDWYSGTADAIYQNMNCLQDHKPEHVLILSGDHIYNMDFNELVQQHIETDADLTASVLTIKKDEASEFGVLAMDKDNRITEFIEKPQDPSIIPGEGDDCYINMGIYLFKTDALVRNLSEDARRDSDHDFGKNIIPNMLKNYKVNGFEFVKSRFGQYWRDVGTIASYYDANLDFLSDLGKHVFSPPDWRIRTLGEQLPPSYFDDAGLEHAAVGTGSNLTKCKVINSIIGRNVVIEEGTEIRDSIIMSNARIGKNCKIKKVIFDHDAHIPDNIEIGYNREEDMKRFFLSDDIVVLPKYYRYE